MPFKLNYDDAIMLDAEELAEGGIVAGYELISKTLSQHVKTPAKVVEIRDDNTPSYSVRAGKLEFAIYGPELEEKAANSWGRATVALFSIVNSQLKKSTHRFYAINGGNDLLGIFLTPTQAKDAQKSLTNKSDWPYLPKDEPPYYGMPH